MNIYYQVYYTPSRLARIFPSHSPKCWRNCDADGNIFHIWWECPYIASFWKSIAKLLHDITGISCILTPQVALFGLALSSWPPKFHAIVTQILIAACLAVARSWKNPISPPLSTVISTINDHCHMEFLFAKTHLAMSKFTTFWLPWMSYTRSIPLPF